ncbi:hypothetical protein [Azonexus sp.]|uniref:hypothetical protein n=1 Tax=Azonexus sp. TaxID=1872668 RepID=UPI0027B89D5D|nr:hypothetical protein [Azonexus sp.]
MITRTLIAALLASVLSFPASAAYKCKKSSGYVYQDKPCIAQAPPDSPLPKAPPPESPATQPQETETAARLRRDKEYLAAREKERRRAELRYEIELSENRISGLEQQMDSELAILRARKSLANNNLAGATLEQSISVEMQAVTQKYSVQIDVEQQRIERMRKDLAGL